MQQMNKMKFEMNEYHTRNDEAEQIIDGRYNASQNKQEWNYNEQVKETNVKNRHKYQDVAMTHHVEFLSDMKNLIFDPKRFPQDLNLFTQNSDWRLIGFQQQQFSVLSGIPSNQYLKKKGQSGKNFDEEWGPIELEGKLNAKFNQINYMPMHFNLRARAIFFYEPNQVDKQQSESFFIQFSETTFNYQSQNDEYFSLKYSQKVLKIKKQNQSREPIRMIEKKILLCSFRGAFCLRNQAPSPYIEDYIIKQIDTIRGVDFIHETHIKQLTGSRYYREAIGGFFYLLNKQSFKRKTISGQLTYPKWLKPMYKSLPNFQMNLITNIVPNKVPLMNLKIKLHESEVAHLNENLKYIFPFYKKYIKRTLIVYESNLNDDQVKYMMNQISYPMHAIGLPKNQLSIIGLEYTINASSRLYHEVIDFSFNAKMMSIGGSKIFALANANPSLKKLTLKGCYVLLGQEDQFFIGLSNNMCLKEFQIDYMDNYNDFMIKHLANYDAQVY